MLENVIKVLITSLQPSGLSEIATSYQISHCLVFLQRKKEKKRTEPSSNLSQVSTGLSC